MANLEQIKFYLSNLNLPYKVIDLGGEVFTVKGVTEAGIDRDQIVKTLIIRTNGDFVALAVQGTDRVDFKKVRRLFGNKSGLAKAEEVQKVVGVPIGAVCPVLVGVSLYFDQRVMKLKYVNMGSGDLEHGLEMKFSDLLSAVGEYKVCDLV